MDKSRKESKPCEPLVRSMQRLQEVFNVSTMNAMKTRLESIAKQQGLGFHVTDGTCYLTADLFYLEVVLLACGDVQVVKVAPHGGAPVPSDTFLQLLRNKDFAMFSKKLGDLYSQYNIPGDAELKVKLFESLQVLGKDLEQISCLPSASVNQSSQVDNINYGIVGAVTFGKEDCPLTVHFYVSPESEEPVHTAQLNIGLCDVTHCLQMASSLSQPPQLDAHGFPKFKSPNEVPSDQVSACFLLKLQPAIAMVPSLWHKLSQITDMPVPVNDLQWAPLPTLLRAASSRERTAEDRDIISTVSVAEGGKHTYVFPVEAWEGRAHKATLVDSVPFTHLSHVPALLDLLRHQCAINAMLMSAMSSTCSTASFPHELHFEVLPESDTSFTLTFRRPDTDGLCVLVVDLPGSRQLTCRLFGAELDNPSLEECFSAVMKRTHSVPMTLQALYSKMMDLAPPADVSMTDTFPPSAAVPDQCEPTSVSQPQLLSEPQPSPPGDPPPPSAAFSPWTPNNYTLSELI
uniref:Mediator of RNA polymerase II transcription subunit 1 n=1 Tax=Knipowitschia caucasica TaxID=637954 RepID=A0AAV2L851_KNICA